MRVPNDHPLRLTAALRRPETAVAAAERLRGDGSKTALDGLVELVLAPCSAQAAVAAISALDPCSDPIVRGALVQALDSPHITVRVAAIESLQRRGPQVAPCAQARVADLLRRDRSWMVRLAALGFLSQTPDPSGWQILDACTDPHWRVRHGLIRVLLAWGESAAERDRILDALTRAGDGPRVRGLRNYLRYRWSRGASRDEPMPEPEDPRSWCSFWDADPAVLARTLKRMGHCGRRAAVDLMPRLLAHDDARVRRLAAQTLRRDGEARHLAAAVRVLDEPRHEAADTAAGLLEGLDLDRRAETARWILESPRPSPAQLAWAALGASDQTRANEKGTGAFAPNEPNHPYVRAALLTPALARALVEDPCRETSWHVLARAASLCRVPLWDLEPQTPWEAPPEAPAPMLPVRVQPATPPHARPLGPGQVLASPVGISGHYGLPAEGFARALETGVNLLFWEPRYLTMNQFLRRLGAAGRNAVHFIAGSFEAERDRIRQDAERALRVLDIERLALFLLFWVRSWDRVSDDVREALDALKLAGKIGDFGLSTHSRPLAVEAVRRGWDPIMVRHSAAHRGAEDEVLPRAAEAGTSVITFNNTCYGRLLHDEAGEEPVRTEDLYRYSLAQPGVTACLAAPKTVAELEAALTAAAEPALDPERAARLRRRGERVYQEDRVFGAMVRSQ